MTNISFKKKHICEEWLCSTVWKDLPPEDGFERAKMVPNKLYVDGKCDKYGQTEEASCIYIKSYDDNFPWVNPDEIVITDSLIHIVFDYPLNIPVQFTFSSPGGFTRKHVVECIVNTYKQIYKDEEETAPEQEFYSSNSCNTCDNIVTTQCEFTIDHESSMCSICHDNYTQHEPICKLPCDHEFHNKCIKQWFEHNKTCPMCRQNSYSTLQCGKCKDGIIKTTYYVGKVLPVELRTGLINRPTTQGCYGIWGHDIGDLVIEGVSYNPDTKHISMFIGS